MLQQIIGTVLNFRKRLKLRNISPKLDSFGPNYVFLDVKSSTILYDFGYFDF